MFRFFYKTLSCLQSFSKHLQSKDYLHFFAKMVNENFLQDFLGTYKFFENSEI
jgi:hypothetical protein